MANERDVTAGTMLGSLSYKCDKREGTPNPKWHMNHFNSESMGIDSCQLISKNKSMFRLDALGH